ncbi:MAG: FAD-dependent oxidoreductase [Cellvibrionales bacterium]|nr:FAD-dependent oxidoreductase [Cellvibrionales bacterium]
MNAIAVLGGGLAGSLTALALAQKGFVVTLYEQDAVLMNAASLHNEGKLHLGYVYAADPHQKTYKKMIQGCVHFFSVIEQLTGINHNMLTQSSPFYYAILPDSQLSVDAIQTHFSLVDDALSALPFNVQPSFACRPDEIKKGFNLGAVQAVFQTHEFSIDPLHLASVVYAAVMENPNILVNSASTLLRAEHVGGHFTLESHSLKGKTKDVYTHVINCLWQNRMAFDRQVGLIESRGFILRYKATIRFYLPKAKAESLGKIVSATYVTGPFGDVVNYQNGYLYLSWYPFSKLHESTSDDLSVFEDKLATLNTKAFVLQSIQVLSKYQPALSVLVNYVHQASVSGGYIFAWGQSDIDDPVSELHQRHDIGVHRLGNWLSVDTGKFTTAPFIAMQAAQRMEAIIKDSVDQSRSKKDEACE